MTAVRLGDDRIFNGGDRVAGGFLRLPDGRFIAEGQAHARRNTSIPEEQRVAVTLDLDESGSVTIPGDVPAADYYYQAFDPLGVMRAEGNLKIV